MPEERLEERGCDPRIPAERPGLGGAEDRAGLEKIATMLAKLSCQYVIQSCQKI